jgi:hypothetical protein
LSEIAEVLESQFLKNHNKVTPEEVKGQTLEELAAAEVEQLISE